MRQTLGFMRSAPRFQASERAKCGDLNLGLRKCVSTDDKAARKSGGYFCGIKGLYEAVGAERTQASEPNDLWANEYRPRIIAFTYIPFHGYGSYLKYSVLVLLLNKTGGPSVGPACLSLRWWPVNPIHTRRIREDSRPYTCSMETRFTSTGSGHRWMSSSRS